MIVIVSMSIVWVGIINLFCLNEVVEYYYEIEGEKVIYLKKGEEMGVFCLGLIVINFFFKNMIIFVKEI